MKTIKSNRLTNIVACVVATSSIIQIAAASPVSLQQATATFSQNFLGINYSVAKAIDGIVNTEGWAVARDPFSTSIPSETAAFETVADIGFVSGSVITFTLNQGHPGHSLGRFRFSVTTDNRSLFADGLDNAGDVTANWVVLNPTAFLSANGATLTKLGDNSILASGVVPDFDVYTISAPTSLTGITGIRLEALEDPSLPFGGPGRSGGNGNFVVSELTVDIVAVPEPSSIAILAISGLILVVAPRGKHA